MNRYPCVQSNSIEHDVAQLSASELQELYGIEFIEGSDSKSGSVWDPVANREFATLAEWAAHQIQEEQWSNLTHTENGARGYDEDYDF